jgi:hypothetical protein
MLAAITPGEWRRGEDCGVPDCPTAPHEFSISADDVAVIATIDHREAGTDADAEFIAAAPELVRHYKERAHAAEAERDELALGLFHADSRRQSAEAVLQEVLDGAPHPARSYAAAWEELKAKARAVLGGNDQEEPRDG